MTVVKITLKNGSIREVAKGTTMIELARQLSGRLGKEVIAATYNGILVDLQFSLEADGAVNFYTFEDEEGKRVFRHTTAHILAQAVKRIYPNVKLGIGPAIEKGFYYDFDLESSFKPDDLIAIEKEMAAIVKANYPIEKSVMSRLEAIHYFKEMGETYKVELIEALEATEQVTVYKQGDFVDFCKGPHLLNTGSVKAIKLLSATGAYWKGDQQNKMLQRIYGVSFPKKSQLESHIEKLEEAKKRDHNKLGRDLELFTTVDVIGQGLPLLMPKGAKIIQQLQRFVEDEEANRGYLLTKTPMMAKSDLYKISGHWNMYREDMFVIPNGVSEDDAFALRSMTCPFQFYIYKAKPRSYRELPMRYAETSTLFRNESSGEMHGLIRLRQFTISEGHLIVMPEQLEDEFKGVVDLINYMMSTLGIIEDVSYRFSKWDPSNASKYVGSVDQWEETQAKMRTILDRLQMDYEEAIGEAAFYGPKLDIQFKNVHGKEDTIITVQIDFALAERFDMTYTDREGEKKYPFVIHRTSVGCYERTLAMLIEKYAGKFPTWLAPTQVKLLTLSERHNAYANQIATELRASGFRVEIDDRAEKIGYKIREAQHEKSPYMLIIGDEDLQKNCVSVRSRDLGIIGQLSLEAFKSTLHEEVQTKSLKSIFLPLEQ
ncbi:threonine--tRNA ligase [Fusibacter ferrireducens]|uniref:Threonine--tRNA ligase n=1 Tax=Fusibacter ferrireducens TaxID=2785058 RepID=A0ABR9ZSE2_9FIRM|nr:threonine--tRNA ligase [Fusibacter ferrireducens]MBF4692820.1 threonine--tRNA ligase [Fusibacter ferrireducens]